MRKQMVINTGKGATVSLLVKSPEQMIKDKGLDPSGDVQVFHTQNVLRRIKRYMPFVSGHLYKLAATQTDIRVPMIVLRAPQGKYLFYGKKMIDPKIGAAGFMTPEGWRSRRRSVKVLTSEPLKYNKTKNPSAGPRWDRALVSAEGKAIAAELQSYINRR